MLFPLPTVYNKSESTIVECVGQEIEKVWKRDIWVNCYSIKISKHKWEEMDMRNGLGYRHWEVQQQNRMDRIRELRYGDTYITESNTEIFKRRD